MKKNVIHDKSYSFAVNIVFACQELSNQKNYVISNQLLKSGTSIGANVRESKSAESEKDFIHKLSVALKESNETDFWLNLIKDCRLIPAEKAEPLIRENNELERILSKIILTLKNKPAQQGT